MKNLVLFFTYGKSLEDWDKNGILSREIDIYKRLLKHFDKIYFITYGKKDLKFKKFLPENIVILPKKINTNDFFYSFLIPLFYNKELRDSSWLKTNQIMGSWCAVISKILFKKKLNIRTGYTESLTHLNNNIIKKILIIIIEFIAYKISDVSMLTSEFQKYYIIKKYKTKNINVISNGINTETFKPLQKKVTSKKNKLLFIGRLHKEKNILNLLEAVRDLKNYELKIIGEGALKKYIIEFSKKYNINLIIIPKVSNNILPKIYNESDIYLQPSLYEGNPKAILEAMSCGLPVIATDVTGINNIIIHRHNGYLCKIKSDSIRKAILDLSSDNDLKNKISRVSREYIKNNYDLDKIIKEEIKLYENNN